MKEMTHSWPQPDMVTNRRPSSSLAFLRPSFLLILLAIFLSPFSALRVWGFYAASDLLVPVAFICLLFEGLYGRRLWLPAWLLIPAGLLSISFIVTYLTNYGSIVDFKLYFGVMNASILTAIVVVSQAPLSWANFRLLFYAWLFSTGIVALLAIMHSRFSFMGFLGQYYYFAGARESGLTYHPNALALYCSIAGPVVLAFMLTSRRLFSAASWAGLYIILAWAIELTGSRAGLVAAACAFVTVCGLTMVQSYGWLRLRTSLRLLMVLVVGTLSLLLLINLDAVDSAIARLLEGGGTTSYRADQVRQRTLDWVLQDIIQNPFLGNGFRYILTAHNHVLEMLHSAGILGLLAYTIRELGFLFATLVTMYEARRRGVNGALAIGFVGSFVAWFVFGLKHDILIVQYGYIGFSLAILLRGFGKPLSHSQQAESVPKA